LLHVNLSSTLLPLYIRHILGEGFGGWSARTATLLLLYV
jgi:hypothetical protein